jgi:hypothetical protein
VRALGATDTAEAANGDTVRVGQASWGTATTTITNTAASSSAVAIKGFVSTTGAGGSTVGVWGQSAAQNGNGVFGYVTDGSTGAKGVWGRSVNGRGVEGEATGTSSQNFGVYGTSASGNGIGVYGTSPYAGLHGQGGSYGIIAFGVVAGLPTTNGGDRAHRVVGTAYERPKVLF